MKEVGDILKLGDVVLPITTVFNQERESVIKFTTSVSRIKFCKLPVDGAPSFGLLRSVVYARDRFPTIFNSNIF